MHRFCTFAILKSDCTGGFPIFGAQCAFTLPPSDKKKKKRQVDNFPKVQSKEICKQVIPGLTNNVRHKTGCFKKIFPGCGFVFVGCRGEEQAC